MIRENVANVSDLLVWMDLEMTGLDPEKERIIEVAIVVTAGDLSIVAEGPELVLHQPDEILAAMDEWNRTHHGQSGLTERVRASTVTEATAEQEILSFLDAHVPTSSRPVLAGNSIHQDRRFIRRYFPALDHRLHYRMVDVSTVKELAKRWYPGIMEARPPKNESHRALDDVRESIAELRFYREKIFVAALPATPAAAPPGSG